MKEQINLKHSKNFSQNSHHKCTQFKPLILSEGEDTPKTFDLKLEGGTVDGITWDGGHEDYSVGDELILIIEKGHQAD